MMIQIIFTIPSFLLALSIPLILPSVVVLQTADVTAAEEESSKESPPSIATIQQQSQPPPVTFVFLPEHKGDNGGDDGISYSLGPTHCLGTSSAVNGTATEGVQSCIGEIVTPVQAVHVPLALRTYEYKLPRPVDTICSYQVHFGTLQGKFKGQLNWAGKWPKEEEDGGKEEEDSGKDSGNRRRFWIVLSRFGKYVEGSFREPRHLLAKGPVDVGSGKFVLEVDGPKPRAMYIWIYELVKCEEDDVKEDCLDGEHKEEKIGKLFHSVIVENPALSDEDQGYEFEYEIDLNAAEDTKREEFTGRYTKVFRDRLNERWNEWWEEESKQFRLAETDALALQHVDFVFFQNENGLGQSDERNSTIIVSGKPAIEI